MKQRYIARPRTVVTAAQSKHIPDSLVAELFSKARDAIESQDVIAIDAPNLIAYWDDTGDLAVVTLAKFKAAVARDYPDNVAEDPDDIYAEYVLEAVTHKNIQSAVKLIQKYTGEVPDYVLDELAYRFYND